MNHKNEPTAHLHSRLPRDDLRRLADFLLTTGGRSKDFRAKRGDHKLVPHDDKVTVGYRAEDVI